VAEHRELHVVADARLHLGEQIVGREAGQYSPVEVDARLGGHDVDLLAGPDHGCVDRVVQ
jgi:hypothetical protein